MGVARCGGKVQLLGYLELYRKTGDCADLKSAEEIGDHISHCCNWLLYCKSATEPFRLINGGLYSATYANLDNKDETCFAASVLNTMPQVFAFKPLIGGGFILTPGF